MSEVSAAAGRVSGWGAPGERPGRFGLVFLSVWTVFLIQPLAAGWERRGTTTGWVGMGATLAFTAVYLVAMARRRALLRGGRFDPGLAQGVPLLLTLATLAVVMCASVGQAGTASGVYLCVLTVMALPRPWAMPTVAVTATAFYVAGLLVPGWSHDVALLLSMVAAALAVWGVQQLMVRNLELVAVERENRRLAVTEERSRFARDLHDILGHSLTVITVKAELAGKLLDVDPDRARAELADLERLSRDALADVRRAVAGIREPSLPGELAQARSALEAAGIDARLPQGTEMVPTHARELFAWAVREGVTNVIRHSDARRCTIELAADRVDVRDDGAAALWSGAERDGTGHGLVGLRERAALHDAVVLTRALDPGFALSVVLR